MERNHDKSVLNQFQINFDLYMKINKGKICLTQEIRQRFLGVGLTREDSDEEEVILHTKTKKGI